MKINGKIYKIENKKNKKIYIGQTIVDNLNDRWCGHKNTLRNKTHHNGHLQKSWDKYGETNFFISLVEGGIDSLKNLNDKEEYYIDKFNTLNRNFGYNVRAGGGNKKLTEEHKKKIGKAQIGKKLTDEHKKKIGLANRGKKRNPLTIEHRKKISQSHMGLTHTPETRRILSEKHTGKKLSKETIKKLKDFQKNVGFSKKMLKKMSIMGKINHPPRILPEKEKALIRKYYGLGMGSTKISKILREKHNIIHNHKVIIRILKEEKLYRPLLGYTKSDIQNFTNKKLYGNHKSTIQM